MRIGEAGNTRQYALAIVVEKGYKVVLTGDEGYLFKASKDDNTVVSANELELLALVLIAESFGEKWFEEFCSDYYSELLYI